MEQLSQSELDLKVGKWSLDGVDLVIQVDKHLETITYIIIIIIIIINVEEICLYVQHTDKQLASLTCTWLENATIPRLKKKVVGKKMI